MASPREDSPQSLFRGVSVKAMNMRTSFMTRMTPLPGKPVSVVPYAPERLSITQDVLTPAMAASMARGIVEKNNNPRNTNGLNPLSTPDEPVNTLFAALKMRRAFQRAKAGRILDGKSKEAEVKANLDRHLDVLARYKIRRVNIDLNETKRLQTGKWLMVNPHSTVYKMWQLGTLILIIYQSIILPYSLAFGEIKNSSVIDTVTNIVFGVDIVIQFNTPIACGDGECEYITDRYEIAMSYLKGWLFFDLLACIPFDTVLLMVNEYDGSKSGSNLNALGLLKALRIPRLLRLVRLLRVVKILKIRPEIRRWMQYSRHANLLRLVRLVLSFLLINHYVACIWWGTIASDTMKSLDSNTDPVHLYLISFYTTLLVVMGQNIPLYDDAEYAFCVAAMLLGAILMAVVFGNVAILIANYYENQSSHQKKMEWLFASMTRMNLPMDLQNRINDYYQAMWERHGTLDGAVTAFIPELSRNLAYEVELFLRMDMINRAPIFQSCSAKVVQELVMELELQVFMPGDYIVVRGEVGNDMYFVQSGVCEVTKDISPEVSQSFHQARRTSVDTGANEIVLKALGQGDYFGEIALLMNCKRTANVRASIFSELCALTREVFESISLRYLEDRNIIEKFIMDKYDPGMLQAALKQSRELAMQSSTTGIHRAGLHKPVAAATDPESATILRRIEERVKKLEAQLVQDAQERRDSEIRRSMAEARLSTTSDTGLVSTPRLSTNRRKDGMLGFEPERVSQRQLLDPIDRQSLNGTAIMEVATGATDEMAETHAMDEMTDALQNEPKKIWERPSMNRSGSWRNARRDSSAGSLRLRGMIKPQSSQLATRSSKSSSIKASIAAAEITSFQHSMFSPEPLPRASTQDSAEGAGDELSAASLDDLANTLAQYEQLDAKHKAQKGPTLDYSNQT